LKRIFITGTAGFIGFHLANLLLREKLEVRGYDCFNNYYDVRLKEQRNEILLRNDNFSVERGTLEDASRLNAAISEFKPDGIVHLAAQAGVRYSATNPEAYISSNIVGTFNILEAARAAKVRHFLFASSSSVYGASPDLPYSETGKADTPLSLYAATKVSAEAMAHAYAHMWNLPATGFRFFTVYGPWGRPDMAPHKFASAILEGRPINVHNHGNMYRDFTYVEDLVSAIWRLLDVVPEAPGGQRNRIAGDSLSLAAPYRVVNIGNSEKIRLLDFIEAIEQAAGRQAVKNFVDAEPGEMIATWADTSLLSKLTGYLPHTSYRTGVARFVEWFRSYYGV
jgi:UDP-glucuronate 4-epimerase